MSLPRSPWRMSDRVAADGGVARRRLWRTGCGNRAEDVVIGATSRRGRSCLRRRRRRARRRSSTAESAEHRPQQQTAEGPPTSLNQTDRNAAGESTQMGCWRLCTPMAGSPCRPGRCRIGGGSGSGRPSAIARVRDIDQFASSMTRCTRTRSTGSLAQSIAACATGYGVRRCLVVVPCLLLTTRGSRGMSSSPPIAVGHAVNDSAASRCSHTIIGRLLRPGASTSDAACSDPAEGPGLAATSPAKGDMWLER